MRPIVTDRVVCRSFTVVSSANVSEPIEMQFELRTRVGSKNHVLDGVPDPPWEEAISRGKRRPIVNYRDPLPWAVQKLLNRSRCRLALELGWPKETYIMWGPEDAHWRHLLNTIAPSMCDGDAAFCQITLTTCQKYLSVNIEFNFSHKLIDLRFVWQKSHKSNLFMRHPVA